VSPGGDSRGGPLTTDRPTAENPGEKFDSERTSTHPQDAPWRAVDGDVVLETATADRRARARRVRQMERAVTDARRRGDAESVRLLTAWLEVEYERRSYLRLVDPTIVRLRRELRRAA